MNSVFITHILFNIDIIVQPLEYPVCTMSTFTAKYGLISYFHSTSPPSPYSTCTRI